MANRTKKMLELNFWLFKWKSENLTVKEVALILGMVMVFFLVVIILLEAYAIPALTAPPILGKIGFAIRKILGARSP